MAWVISYAAPCGSIGAVCLTVAQQQRVERLWAALTLVSAQAVRAAGNSGDQRAAAPIGSAPHRSASQQPSNSTPIRAQAGRTPERGEGDL
eukprot:gene848-7987_t